MKTRSTPTKPDGQDLPLDITKDFSTITNLILTGQNGEADFQVTKKLDWPRCACYQTLGNLHLKFEGTGEVSDYLRELDLRDAVAKVHYRQNGVGFDREVFISHPDDATIIRLYADKAGALNFQVTLDSQHPTAKSKSSSTNEFVMSGQLPGFALRRSLEIC